MKKNNPEKNKIKKKYFINLEINQENVKWYGGRPIHENHSRIH